MPQESQLQVALVCGLRRVTRGTDGCAMSMDARTLDHVPSAATHKLQPSPPSPACGSCQAPFSPSTNALRLAQSIRAILREKWTLTFGWASARDRRAAERAAREIELIDDLWSGSYS